MVEDDPVRELAWLRRVRDLCQGLASEQDRRRLLPKILDAAIEITSAERGFLVLVEGRKPDGGWRFRVEVARGFDKVTLQGARGGVSRTVVRRVLDRGDRGLVTTSEEDADITEITSVTERRVLSILCAPMRARGQVRGVLYLDHRFERRAFTEQDLPVLATFADQAALALEALAPERDPPAPPPALSPAEEARAAPLRPAPPPAGDAPVPEGPSSFGRLIGRSALMQALYRDLERAARSDAPVLILGESGTGKELVARELHARSSRSGEPFVSENCAAVAEGVLESELFGHVKGAFTGADASRPGLFRQARGGTLLLDEVGETSPIMQAKLLRVLQEGCVRPVGGQTTEPVSCRVVAATNRDLAAMVREGTFRADLFYRLDVLRLITPPLRERREDIPLLIDRFAARVGRPLELAPDALDALMNHAWPGNVRELENEVHRLLALGADRVTAADLSPEVRGATSAAGAPPPYRGLTLDELERAAIGAALEAEAGNKAAAARRLGVPRTTLYHLLEKHGLA